MLSKINIFKKIINFYLYDTGGSKEDDLEEVESKRKASLVIVSSLVLSLVAFTIFLIRFQDRGMTQSKTFFLIPAASITFLLLPLLIKFFNKTSFVIHCNIAIGIFILFLRSIKTGGLESPVLKWFCLVPVVASLVSVRSGLVWTTLAIFAIISLLFADTLGLQITNIEQNHLINTIVLVFLLIILAYISIFFEIQRIENEKLILEKEKELANNRKFASLGQLSGGISHEINNPLSVVAGRVKILSSLSDSNQLNNEELKKGLESISKSVGRIESIVNSLRIFSNDDYMKSFKHVNLCDVINDVVDGFRERESECYSSVKLINEFNREEVIFYGNAALIRSATLNLLDNACYEAAKTDDPWVKIHLVEDSAEDYFIIAITDSGKGVRSGIVDRIMDPFFTTKAVGEGTGLGLSLAQNIVNMHEGRLRINSECENTQFEIWLPKDSITKTV